MQVTETNSEGLKREFKVVVPAADLDARLNDRLVALKDRVQIRGFRPGKVPVTHLKKVYGRAVMAETIDEVVRETNAKIVTDHNLKLAMDPKITMPESETEIEGVISGKSDLAYTIAIEVVPPIALADFKQIALTRLTAGGSSSTRSVPPSTLDRLPARSVTESETGITVTAPAAPTSLAGSWKVAAVPARVAA
jgi:trigger factor